MNKVQNIKTFCCPEIVPPNACDDFCIPEDCCPPRLETPKFPSPTSCLPKDQTEILDKRIDAVNQKLLILGLSNEAEELGKMKALEGLIGQLVEIKLDCEELDEEEASMINVENVQGVNKKVFKKEVLDSSVKIEKWKQKIRKWEIKIDKIQKRKIEKGKQKIRKWEIKIDKIQKRKNRILIPRLGKGTNLTKISKKNKKIVIQQDVNVMEKVVVSGIVCVVGRDFVVLKKDNEQIVIPLSKIISIKSNSRIVPPLNNPRLLDIDPCLRRSLTFRFGETVACSPELIDIFFKLTLAIYLLSFLHEKVRIKAEAEEFEGILEEVNNKSMLIAISNEEMREVPFLSICFLSICA